MDRRTLVLGGLALSAQPAWAASTVLTPAALAKARRNKVVSALTERGGRAALRVGWGDDPSLGQEPDPPTFVVAPVRIENGTIELELLSRLAPGAPPETRAFAGLAYRIQPDLGHFEGVYLRPTNGLSLKPPPPRDRRAVQYFAQPTWDFDRLRRDHPDGSYEAGADIAPDRWMTLKLELAGRRVTASVDGKVVLSVEGKVQPKRGAVGLWVGVGTEAYFGSLKVTPA